MYNQILTQTCFSSQISFSVFCNLSRPSYSPGFQCHLVTANNSILSIYAILYEETPSSHKMVHVKSFKLEGSILGLSKISSEVFLSGFDSTEDGIFNEYFDYLLLSFSTFKVSIVQYQEKEDILKTIGLISFEDLYTEKDIRLPVFLPQTASLSIDPQSRMAAIPLSRDSFGFISFNHIEKKDLLFHPKCYILTNLKSSIDNEIRNIVDFCFLEDYNIPALALLVEPKITDPCRINLLKDTKVIYWLSLSNIDSESFINLGRHPNLPSDAFKVLAMKKPVGGLLVLSSNAFIHLDSLGRSFILPVNSSFQTLSSQIPSDNTYTNLELDLSKCEIQFVNSFDDLSCNFMISLLDGSLFMLTLFTKSGYSGILRAHLMNIAATSSIFSCISCKKFPDRPDVILGFLGTTEGPHNLIFELWKENNKPASTSEALPMDQLGDEELDLYSPTISLEKQQHRVAKCSPYLSVVPSEITGWNVSIVCGFPNISFSTENCFSEATKSITYSSFNYSLLQTIIDKHSGRPLLQPDILSILPSLQVGCQEITCISVSAQISYIFLSSESSTLILKSQGGQLTEVLDPLAGFFVEGPTTYVFSLTLSEAITFIVQVTKNGVFILSSTGHLLFHWNPSELPVFSPTSDMDIDDAETGLPKSVFSSAIVPLITFASHCAHYLAIMLEDGALIVFSIKNVTFLEILFNSTDNSRISLDEKSFKLCNIFSYASEYILGVYSNSPNTAISFYHLPSMNRLWMTSEIVSGPRILFPGDNSRKTEVTSSSNLLEFWAVEGFGGTLLLLLRYSLDSSSDFSFFSIYYCKNFNQVFECNTKILFIKLEHQIICTKSFPSISKNVIPIGPIGYHHDLVLEGIMLLGSNPHCMIFSKSKQSISNETHDQIVPSYLPVLIEVNFPDDSRPLSITPISFSGSNTFLTLNHTPSNSLLMICKTIPTGLYPFFSFPEARTILWDRKPLATKPGLINNDSISKIISLLQNDPESGCILAISETPVPFTIPPTEAELASSNQVSNDVIMEEGTSCVRIPMTTPITSLSYLELISPLSWLVIDRIKLLPYEQCLSFKRLSLNSRQTTSGVKWYFVIGTAFIKGEDRSVRGRILIVEVINVIPDANYPESNHRLKIIYEGEERGPVSSIDEVSGYLVTSIGPKLIVHSFGDGETLDGVAFMDLSIYITSICVIKNYIILGDAYKSITLAAFQEDPPKLIQLGKDFSDLRISAAQVFPIMDSQLSIIVGDESGNIHSFSYSPSSPSSLSGLKLIHRADYFVSPHPILSLERKVFLEIDKNQTKKLHSSWVCYRSSSGEIGRIDSISEMQFKRFLLLYSNLLSLLATSDLAYSGTPAGLNHREYRSVKCLERRYLAASKNSLDFSFILRKLSLLSIPAIDGLARISGWKGAKPLLEDLLTAA